MTGVEQKMGWRPRMRHEGFDVGLGLDDRAHVMMVAELQAFGGQEFGEFGDLRAISGPFVGGERGAA